MEIFRELSPTQKRSLEFLQSELAKQCERSYRIVEEARQMRELQNRNLEADLKRQFMTANPAATEQSWLLEKAEVKQNYFLERMKAEKSRDEIEAEKYAGYRM